MSATETWEKDLACSTACTRCGRDFGPREERILSVFDDGVICTACKREEEKRPDHAEASRQMVARCIGATGRPWGDPAGFCFHHFVPFRCR